MRSWHLHKSCADEKWRGLLFLLTLRCLLLSSSSQIRLDMQHGLPPLDQSNYLSHSLRDVSTESYCLIPIWTQQLYFVQPSISIVLHNIAVTFSSCTRYNRFESQCDPVYRVLYHCFFQEISTCICNITRSRLVVFNLQWFSSCQSANMPHVLLNKENYLRGLY